MQLSNQQTLPVSQQLAWEALNDISMLQAAIPGCESIVETGENAYDVIVVAAIGPVKAKFKGKLALSDIVAPVAYKIAFEGQGGAAGHGKGSAEVRLESAGGDETVLHYNATASVGGKIAQLGSRLVDMAANKMATEFFNNFNARLQERHGVQAAEDVAPEDGDASDAEGKTPGKLKQGFKKLFGG